MLAVLQENHVELRCLDDEFVVAIAKCPGMLLLSNKQQLGNLCCCYIQYQLIPIHNGGRWFGMRIPFVWLLLTGMACLIIRDDSEDAVISSGEVFVFSSNGQRLCHIDSKVTWYYYHGYCISTTYL